MLAVSTVHHMQFIVMICVVESPIMLCYIEMCVIERCGGAPVLITQ